MRCRQNEVYTSGEFVAQRDPSEERVRSGVFRERQLLIRQADRVHSIRLSPRRQRIAAAAGGLAVGAMLASLGGLVWQHAALRDQGAELAQTRESHDTLAARVEATLAEARAVDRRFPAVAPQGVGRPLRAPKSDLAALENVVHRLAERPARLNERLANARERREQARTERARLQRREADLEEELSETRDALRAATSGRENLGDRLAKTLADLYHVRTKYQAALAEREAAEAEIAELSGQFAGVRAGETPLQERVAGLSSTLKQARSKRDKLLPERKRESYRERNEKLSKKVASLRTRLETVRKTQSGLFSHYTAQARNSLAAIEQTVAMTGLDVDRLVRKARDSRSNLGGPFVPASKFPDAVGHSAQKLDRQMQRLRILQNVLGRLPLTPPIDSYWISSDFGKRRDPYNGRWAMHEGLDLAGQSGLTVHAAAPGKVVHAGREGGYGRMVAIDHGYGIVSRYGHLKDIGVEAGQSIEHRGALGELGETGRSTGPHVHYEIRVEGEPVDPMNFLKAGKYAFKKQGSDDRG